MRHTQPITTRVLLCWVDGDNQPPLQYRYAVSNGFSGDGKKWANTCDNLQMPPGPAPGGGGNLIPTNVFAAGQNSDPAAHNMQTPNYWRVGCDTPDGAGPGCVTAGCDTNCIPHAIGTIQKDIMMYGPVAVKLTVHPGFLDYRSGVYTHTRAGGDTTGDMTMARDVAIGDGSGISGNLGVRIIGWGTDPDTKEDYWTVAPALGIGFGESGFMRIARGSNQGRIEFAVHGFYACPGCEMSATGKDGTWISCQQCTAVPPRVCSYTHRKCSSGDAPPFPVWPVPS